MKHPWRAAIAVALLLPAVWIAVDLGLPSHGSLRDFDPHTVARLETDM